MFCKSYIYLLDNNISMDVKLEVFQRLVIINIQATRLKIFYKLKIKVLRLHLRFSLAPTI